MVFKYFEEDVHCKNIPEVLDALGSRFYEGEDKLKDYFEQVVALFNAEQKLEVLEKL